MTELFKGDAPVDVPEADLLEQQIPWQNSTAEAPISSGLGVGDRQDRRRR